MYASNGERPVGAISAVGAVDAIGAGCVEVGAVGTIGAGGAEVGAVGTVGASVDAYSVNVLHAPVGA